MSQVKEPSERQEVWSMVANWLRTPVSTDNSKPSPVYRREWIESWEEVEFEEEE